MKPSIEFVSECFIRFNRQIFGGRLSVPVFELGNARNYLGKLCFVTEHMPDGRVRHNNIVMRFNRAIDLSRNELEDVVIHEMIHYHILVNGLRDTGPHGKLFKSMMQTINSRFGRNITVTHRLSIEQKEERDSQIRIHLVCKVMLDDGRCCVTVVARSCAGSLRQQIDMLPNIRSTEWFVSRNPFFNRYPRSRTLKLYLSDDDTLNRELSDAHRINLKLR